MVPIVLVLGLSAAISLALSAMLAIAWANFGRPRHAACWSAAHAIVAVQIAANAALVSRPDFGAALRPLIGAAIIGSGALGLMGVRQRGGDRRWRDVALVAAAAEAVALAMEQFGAVALGIATPGLVTAGFATRAAAMLRSTTSGRPAADRAFRAALLFLAAATLLAALAAATLAAWPWSPIGRIAYAAAFTLAIPLATIVGGIAAVLLIAADLASDLRRLATFDPLTEVHNRRGFVDAARRAIAVAQRRGAAITVALTDIDHFKAVNDRHGHGVGDAVLVAFARHLVRGVRNGDIVARIGGEEFALLLVDLDAASAAAAVERIRALVGTSIRADGAPVDVTASFGLAAIDGEGDTPDALLAAALDRADRALYRAKTGGRDRIVLDAS